MADQKEKHHSHATTIAFVVALLIAVAVIWVTSTRQPDPPADPVSPPVVSKQPATSSPSVVPVKTKRKMVAPLADAYRRIDPALDGWETESFNEAAGLQFKLLAKLIESGKPKGSLSDLVVDAFECVPMTAHRLGDVVEEGQFRIQRMKEDSADDRAKSADDLQGMIKQLRGQFDGQIHVKFKIFRVVPQDDNIQTQVLIRIAGTNGESPGQVTATWQCHWTRDNDSPRLKSIKWIDFEHSSRKNGRLFADCTSTVAGSLPAFRKQLVHGVDHWRARLPRNLGMTVTGNHGLAIGDVNGDGRDDVYVCAEGGLPNLLFLQNDDGTLRDVTVDSGADWLDSCASALLIDVDNDGHQDLLVATAWYLLLMKNDGVGHFELKSAIESQGQLFSLAATDYDADGDLDVYACGYHGTADRMRSGGAMATPIPFHDANNGAPNMLMRNDGNWEFSNQTKAVGLDVNNTRFSYAASWEDYDNDGDVDLYVANDFGRNNLFRNDNGQFADIAASSGVEDMAAGMSVDWADIDNDGLMDLYISNMFSSAGNRITYQPQFKTKTGDDVRSQFQRHARGNTLFRNAGDDRFEDISVYAGVTMGRWAWGSKFVDFNNDGREDIVVANGFITSTDTGDL